MKSFLETLNYSSSNEDSLSEIRSLNINEEDSVLCISGSGARPLDLLIENPKLIVSLDFNDCQNFLLELKMKAIEHFEYQEFLEFLGVYSFNNRLQRYKLIRQSLSSNARHFWDNNSVIIEKGVIYQGRWERYFNNLGQFVSFVRSGLRSKLFKCNSIDEQAKIWNNQWDSFIWRLFLQLISLRTVWKYIFGDPGFYHYVPETFSIYKYLHERFKIAFENIIAHQSPFLTLLFYGKYNPDKALPLHLQKQHYATLRSQLGSIRIVTQSLLDYLIQCKKNSFNKYSLSDFSSYTNVDEYKRIWEEVIRKSSNGAYICERQFLVKRQLPSDVIPLVIRNTTIEEDLARTDNSIFYTFIVARVNRETK
jgi:S-adenosylmethionine-diacylglycerol 3-amino-3-carboxypropyl transferase